MTSTSSAPFSAYTAEAADFADLPHGELKDYLRPFEAGLLMAAGRMLAVCAYRDAARYADRPFDRDDEAAAATVLKLLPESCDRQDKDFRRGVARAFWDLAEDLAAGRAPLPRCQAETWALEVMLETAPRMCAADDEELSALGVPVPTGSEFSYLPPCFEEEAWAFVCEDAKYTIAEARTATLTEDAADGRDDAEGDHLPEGGWDTPVYWFSTYEITRPRDPDRGHPAWADAPEEAAAVPQVPRLERAAQLLGLGEDIDPWEALQDDVLRPRNGTMADVLTPLSARMLAVAAARVVERGWDDLIAYGDRVFPRLDGGPMQGEDSFLWGLPPLCDGQSAAWRLAMVRAVENLGDDLKAGRAPLPTCTAEELAFHLILAEGHALLNDMGDPYYARQLGLPTRDRFTVRHRAFDRWCEAFLQDTDVLLHYDERLALIASDPDHPVSRQLGTGDLRPRAWFAPFGNIRRRSPRPLTDKERGVLAYADPDAFFASTPALSAEGTLPAHADDSAIRLPEGLREEFEHFIGLAQRRFFDEPCAIAMAVSLDRLLTRLFDTEAVVPSHVWPLNPRARAVRAGILIVDHDFCLRGYSRTWRLSADRSDREARDWAVDLLDDCAQYIIARRGQIYDEFLPTRALSDAQVSQLRELLPVRLRDLARDLTVAGLLHHRAQRLGLSVNELAELALLPEPLVAGWLNGVPASPSQLLRCAPALQVSEDALLAALDGKRDTHCWPLPIPPPDRQGHSESATGMPATGEHSMPTLTRTSSRCSSDHD